MKNATNIMIFYAFILVMWAWHQSTMVDSGLSLQARILPGVVPGIFITGLFCVWALISIGLDLSEKLDRLQTEDDDDEEEEDNV